MFQILNSGHSFSGHERNRCFLNTGSLPFANASAVTGLDYADDGRGLVLTDWDLDGDLDVWTTNRNAPRARFLRNDGRYQSHFLSILLRGETCHNDAVGARLELYLAGEPGKRLVRTLHAGEGFLSQASKWVHFGLGEHDCIDRLVVRWPGGTPEVFSNLKADSWYRVVEHSGQAMTWTPRLEPSRVVPVQFVSRSRPKTGRLRKPEPLPPNADFVDLQGRTQQLYGTDQKPLLISLWASWCPNCRAEMQEWVRHEQDLRSSGLRILALNVDGLLGDESFDAAEVRNCLNDLGFRHMSGRATPDLLDQLVAIKRAAGIADAERISLPTNFLIDQTGSVRTVYEGRTSLARIMDDVQWLLTKPER